MSSMLTKKAPARKKRIRPSAKLKAVKSVAISAKTGRGTALIEFKAPKAGNTLQWASLLSPMSVIELSKHGLRANVIKNIQIETGFSSLDMAEYLQINYRTLQRYLQKNDLMNPDVSERALLVAQIAEMGKEVFGDENLFKIWLEAPSTALGGIAPESLLGSSTGMQLIRAELGRIEHGVY
jgi:putative toxin-antitoxin system antitoxin component (TIGR02293 family)